MASAYQLVSVSGLECRYHVVRPDGLPVDWVTAANLVAEIGVNMEQFPSASQLASWAGLCPGNHESAGKRIAP